MLTILFKSGLLGLMVAAPVGPIALLVLRRTLARGWRLGLATGLGAALADGTCGMIAVLGAGFARGFLRDWGGILAIGAAIGLMGIAISTWFAKPKPLAKPPDAKTLLAATVGTWALTLANPLTIIGFLAAFAALRFSAVASRANAWMIVPPATLAGSLIWWMGMVAAAGWAREKMADGWLVWINRIVALALFAGAVYLLLAAAMGWTDDLG